MSHNYSETSSATTPGSPGGYRSKTCDPVTCSDRTSALLRGLCVVLQEHKAQPSLITDFQLQVRGFLDDSSDEKIWVKRCKYLLALPLAKYLKCEAPSPVDRDLHWTGNVRKWIRNRLNAFCQRNTHLWYSWFQCKRCTLVCSGDFISDVYEEHKVKLQSDDPGDPFAIDAAFSNPAFFDLLIKVREGIEDTLLKSKDFRWLDISNNSPSTSACFNGTRLEGGQYRVLRQFSVMGPGNLDLFPGKSIQAVPQFDWGDDFSIPQFYYNMTSLTSELYRMEWFPDIEGSHIHMVEIRQPSGLDDWLDLIHLFKDCYPQRRLNAQIQGIIEPLKVRVISKGEAIPYYFHKALQKALHGTMRRIPCFRLIGRPLCPTDILDIKSVAEPTYQWFSVDYSAATDGLSWRFSEMILRFLLKNFPETDLSWALRVLGPHNLFYPDPGAPGSYTFGGVQRNGQLMGSILSFPILCLANMATYLLTMSDLQQGWSLEKRLSGVLVNGDDMVYAAPEEKWERHVKISGDLGLSMSVGKAYKHPVYCNVNSTSIHLDLRRDCIPVQINYLNTGLLFGSEVQKKKSDDREGSASFVPAINPLLDGCFSARSKRNILSQYFTLHKKKINEECKLEYRTPRGGGTHIRNLFLPCSLGGMGVQPVLGWRFKIKPFDRVLAQSYIQKDRDYSFGLPLCAPLAQEIEQTRPVSWVKSEKSLPEPHKIDDISKKLDRRLIHSSVYHVCEKISRRFFTGPLSPSLCRL